MSASAGSAIPITDDDLALQAGLATQHLTGISYTPKKTVEALRQGDIQKPKQAELVDSRASESRSESVSIIGIAKALNNNDTLWDEPSNAALNIVRTGLEVALHVASAYAKASGFEQLRERNVSRGRLGSDEAEWASKQETHAAITAFVFAYYVSWRFESADEKKVTATVDFAGLPEPIAIGNQIRSIGSVLYHLGSYLKGVQTGAQLHKMTQLYFAAVLKELQSRAASLKYMEPFVDVSYRLTDTSFAIRGFEAQILGGAVVEFKRVEMKEVMGNHEAKRLARRLAQFVMAYDFTQRMNPMTEFGAFPWIFIFQGQAGTGKSMLLSVMQTLVQDYCRALSVPFQLSPIPNSMVSSLQGESAVQYEKWWSQLQNPDAIIVAPVDDAEAVYLDRRSPSSSEGSKLIVMSHLRLTEGSTALTRGNVLQPHATNNADMIDAPVFSRYMARVIVPGAQTRNDYNDQMKSWGDKVNTIIPGKPIIDLQFPKDYVYLSDQGLVPKDEADKKADGLIAFKDKGLVRIWEEVEAKKLTAEDYDLYGTFFNKLHERFDQFTSRDVRNITTSATSRLFGFDFPPEWLENRDTFVGKDYDTKKRMILEKALEFQGGLTVAQVLFQEMVHYVETTVAMLDSGRQYRIRQMADDILERTEAAAMAQQLTAQRHDGATA